VGESTVAELPVVRMPPHKEGLIPEEDIPLVNDETMKMFDSEEESSSVEIEVNGRRCKCENRMVLYAQGEDDVYSNKYLIKLISANFATCRLITAFKPRPTFGPMQSFRLPFTSVKPEDTITTCRLVNPAKVSIDFPVEFQYHTNVV